MTIRTFTLITFQLFFVSVIANRGGHNFGPTPGLLVIPVILIILIIFFSVVYLIRKYITGFPSDKEDKPISTYKSNSSSLTKTKPEEARIEGKEKANDFTRTLEKIKEIGTENSDVRKNKNRTKEVYIKSISNIMTSPKGHMFYYIKTTEGEHYFHSDIKLHNDISILITEGKNPKMIADLERLVKSNL